MMNINGEAMKSCPFCGSENTTVDVYPVLPGNEPYFGTCMDCGSQGARKNTIEEAIEAWNRRTDK